jgi:hypothetical protein
VTVFTPEVPHYGHLGYTGLEEDEPPADTRSGVVTFIEIGPEKEELSMAAKIVKAAVEKPSTPLKVRVRSNYRVVEKGVAYTAPDVLEIPHDKEHDLWIKSGWVELVSEKDEVNGI